MNLNLYLIERTDEVGYDEYDSHVVAEETPRLALLACRWEAVPDSVPSVRLIGRTVSNANAGIVHSSFRAG